MSNIKKCSQCNKIKLLSMFYKDKSRKDGLMCYCKDCQNKNLEKYSHKKRQYARTYYKKHKKDILVKNKALWQKERLIAFKIIADNKPIKCIKHEEWQCCGNSANINCLSLDHIDGRGFIHRKEIKGGTIRLYRWIRKNPEKAKKMLQILCMNAQTIKARLNKEVRN